MSHDKQEGHASSTCGVMNHGSVRLFEYDRQVAHEDNIMIAVLSDHDGTMIRIPPLRIDAGDAGHLFDSACTFPDNG